MHFYLSYLFPSSLMRCVPLQPRILSPSVLFHGSTSFQETRGQHFLLRAFFFFREAWIVAGGILSASDSSFCGLQLLAAPVEQGAAFVACCRLYPELETPRHLLLLTPCSGIFAQGNPLGLVQWEQARCPRGQVAPASGDCLTRKSRLLRL